ANSDADFVLTVTATSQEGSTGPTASTTANLNVIVNPAADPPTATVARATGNEDSAIALSISRALTANAASQDLASLTARSVTVHAVAPTPFLTRDDIAVVAPT